MTKFDPYREWLEIDPADGSPDHYRLLGLTPFESNPQEIQAAADRRMIHVRRFQTGPRGKFTQKLLNELSTAKLCLLNPTAKQRYDDELQRKASEFAGVLADEALSDAPVPPPVAGGLGKPPPLRKRRHASTTVPVRNEEELAEDADDQENQDAATHRTRLAALMVLLAVIGALVTAALVWDPNAAKRTHSAPVVVQGEPTMEDAPDESAPQVPEPRPSPPPTVVQQEANGDVTLPAITAQLSGGLDLVELNGATAIGNWTSDQGRAEWRFRIWKAGAYQLRIKYAVANDALGGVYRIEMSGRPGKTHDIRAEASPGEVVTDEFSLTGKLPAAEHTLSIHAEEMPGVELMQLQEIQLVPFEVK